MKLTRDQIEFALSQYHDGTLPPLERATIDELLAGDESARALLGEYQSLDAALRNFDSAREIALPDLSEQIRGAIAEAAMPIAATYRIGFRTRIFGGGIVAAAAIAIITGIMIQSRNASFEKVTQPAQHARVEVSIAPSPGALATPIEIVSHPGNANVLAVNGEIDNSVKVGPSPQMAAADWTTDEAFVTRPSRVVIAVSPEAAQDAGAAPF